MTRPKKPVTDPNAAPRKVDKDVPVSPNAPDANGSTGNTDDSQRGRDKSP